MPPYTKKYTFSYEVAEYLDGHHHQNQNNPRWFHRLLSSENQKHALYQELIQTHIFPDTSFYSALPRIYKERF